MNEKPPTPRSRWRLAAARTALLTALLLTVGAIAAAPPPGSDPQADNRACLRCHGMATLAYRDATTGGLVDLFIDPVRLAGSVHGELACTGCHAPDYRTWPHPLTATNEQLDCVGCHEQDQARTEYPFAVIAGQFAKSIHATSDEPRARGFSCHSCHDPHGFRVSRVGRPLAEIVRDDNQVCLSCHTEVRDPLRNLHQWLPNRDAHWAAVRCIECHTPVATAGDEAQRVSHRILPARESNLTCVNCHSGNQRLLGRLYAYRSEEDLARDGLLSKAVFNEAYVVGMSRSPLIDRLGLLLIALTALGLIGHGLMRYRAWQRSRGEQA